MKVEGSAVIVMTDKPGTTKLPLPEAWKSVMETRDGAIAAG